MMFKRQNLGKVKRLRKTWRKPKGLHSNQREKKKGCNTKMPNIGYRSPRKVRGVHPSGARETLIKSVNDLSELSKGSVVRLSKIGSKKKIIIINECIKKDIRILNFNNPKEKIKELLGSLENKRKAKLKRKELRIKAREEERKKREAAKKKKEEEKKVVKIKKPKKTTVAPKPKKKVKTIKKGGK